MGGNPMQKSAAAIDQWPCLFLSSPEGGAGGDCGKIVFSELTEGAEGTALEVRQGVRRYGTLNLSAGQSD
jgi:hypothetical protein